MIFCIGSDDEELEKWNVEDERKQIEAKLEESLAEDEIQESEMHETKQNQPICVDENTAASVKTTGSSVELFPATSNASADTHSRYEDLPAFHLEMRESCNWDDSSTIPPGQGEPSGNRINNHEQTTTPFTRLLNIGHIGSARRKPSTDEDTKFSTFDEVCD